MHVKEKSDIENAIKSNAAVLVYFSHDQCNVCKSLKPKIEDLIKESFPKIEMLYCNVLEKPDIAASFTVFTAPTIIIWFSGKETFRFGRNISINEVSGAIQRPYSLFFDIV
jgi:thioredoxin 1